MPKMMCIVDTVGGDPNLDRRALPHLGYVLIGRLAGWGVYIVSGTVSELAAIAALARIVGIVVLTEGATRWAELDGVIAAAVRTKLNTWLTARGRSNIPVGWTYRQVCLTVFRAINPGFLDNFSTHDVA